MSHLLQSCVAQVVVLPRPEARGRRFEFPVSALFAAGEEGRRTAALFARRSLGTGVRLHGGQALDGKRGKPMQLIRGNPSNMKPL